jgi:hypothetical protein
VANNYLAQYIYLDGNVYRFDGTPASGQVLSVNTNENTIVPVDNTGVSGGGGSGSGISQSGVVSSGQLAVFADDEVLFGSDVVSIASNSFTINQKAWFPASTVSQASFNIDVGTYLSTGNQTNGDFWLTASGLYYRAGNTTHGPIVLTSGTIEAVGALMDNEVTSLQAIKELLVPTGTAITDYTASLLRTEEASGAKAVLEIDDTGNIPVSRLNNGTNAGPTTFWRGDGTWVAVSGAGGGSGIAWSTPIDSNVVPDGSGTRSIGSIILPLDELHTVDLYTTNINGRDFNTDSTNLDILSSGAITGQVDLGSEVSGNLPVSHLNGGTGASAFTFWRGDGVWASASGGAGGGGSGNVSTTGTPHTSGLAFWSSGTYLSSDPKIDWNGSIIEIIDDSNYVVRIGNRSIQVGGTTSLPTYGAQISYDFAGKGARFFGEHNGQSTTMLAGSNPSQGDYGAVQVGGRTSSIAGMVRFLASGSVAGIVRGDGVWNIHNSLILDDDLSVSGQTTFANTLSTRTSDTSAASLNLPHGVAPSGPNDGDIWTTAAGLYARINGSTVGPFGTGGSGSMSWSTPVDADIIPDGSGTRDLGSLSSPMGEIHANSGLIGGASIYNSTFGGDITGNASTVSTTDLGGDATTWILLAGSQGGNQSPGFVSGLTWDDNSTIMAVPGSINTSGNINGRDVSADGTKLDTVSSGASVSYVGFTATDGIVVSGSPVTNSGTFSLSVNPTQLRDFIQVDASGTDNSIPVTLAGYNYLSIAGQEITATGIDLAIHVSGDLPVSNLNGGTGASSSTFWRGDGTWAEPAGGGSSSGIATSGSPAVTDIAFFTDSGTIGGTGLFSYDPTTSVFVHENTSPVYRTISDGRYLTIGANTSNQGARINSDLGAKIAYYGCNIPNGTSALVGSTTAANGAFILAYDDTHTTFGDYIRIGRSNQITAYFDDNGDFYLPVATGQIIAPESTDMVFVCDVSDGGKLKVAQFSDFGGGSGEDVSLSGTPDYLVLEGQNITLEQIDLSTDVSGVFNVPSEVLHPYQSGQAALGSSNIDWTISSMQGVDLSALAGDHTFTFTDPSGPTMLTLKLDQGSTARDLTWPTGVKWDDVGEIAWTGDANKTRIISFFYDGTWYYGLPSERFS